MSGNTCVVVASESRPLPAVTLGEVLATSDLPGGVVNLLTGQVGELAPPLASHLDVNAIDLTGVGDAELARDLELEAAENVKRVLAAPAHRARLGGDARPAADPGLHRGEDGLAPDRRVIQRR